MKGKTTNNMLKKYVLFIYHTLIRLLALMLLKSCNNNYLSKANRILIYGSMGIGNMILFVPVLKACRNFFESSKISLLVGKSGAEQVVTGTSLVDEILYFKEDELKLIEKIKYGWKLRQRKYDILISNFNGSLHCLAPLTLLSCIPMRIGHVSSSEWDNIYDCLYNYKIPVEKKLHEIDNNLKLIEALGIKPISRKPYFHFHKQDEFIAGKYLKNNNVGENTTLVGIQMGTSPTMAWKQWSLQKYVELADILIKQKETKVVILGSPQEREFILNAFANCSKKPIVAAGELTLKQTAALIKKLDLVVCNDSGLMHVSVAMDTPVVAIYGPTDFERTAPIGDKHTVIRKEIWCSPCFKLSGDKAVRECKQRICLENINVDDVLTVIEKKIGEKNLV